MMTQATQAILKKALKLKPVERVQLIDELFSSFDAQNTPEIDAAWAAEAEDRVAAYDAGKIRADSAEAVLRRINNR